MALGVATGSLIYLYFSTFYKPLFWVYACAGTLILHFSINNIMDLTHYVDFLWMIAVILVAFIGLGETQGVIFIGINAVGIGYFFWATLNSHIEILTPRSNIILLGDFLEVLLVLFIIAYLLHQYMLFNNYSQKQLSKVNKELEKQNEIVQAKNDENVVLIREVHHRVKNNLQIIISLLRLQKSELDRDSAIKFDEAINRIMTMSLVHQKLYQEEELSNIDLKSYIHELTREIKRAVQLDTDISININSTVKKIGLKTIVPLGLLINELVSNSFKHAFGKNNNGIIQISIESKEKRQIELKYQDNGVWKTPHENSSKFGLELIGTLIEQLEGTLERNESKYKFLFKNLDI
ncbi:MAG: sensor histidine kinase [Flavobacteriales bacterium]|nr:sensor histidine kinase [Flavobacteriales bacterium]